MRLLTAGGVCRLSRQCVAAKQFRITFSSSQRKLQSAIEKKLDHSGYVPVPVRDVRALGREAQAVADALNGKSLVFLSPDFILSKRYMMKAAEAACRYLQSGCPLTLGDFRDVLGVSRQQALLILEYMDRCGITRRVADGRLAGPAARKYEIKGENDHG